MMPVGRPAPGALAYYRGSWRSSSEEDPDTFWYEVDHEGCVLRKVEIFTDGRLLADSIDHYPGRASDFGFGTLIGEDFYALTWPWAQPDESDPTVMLGAHHSEFEAIWNKATAA